MPMMGWAEFVLAFAGFFVTHTVPVRPRNRARLIDLLGQRGFTLGYSVLSLGALAWIIGAAGRAPFVHLWSWAPWQNQVVLVAMVAVCLILAFSIGRPNPFSFGGSRNADFDPAHPGLVRIARHPVLLSLALWALAHIVPNGDLAHVVLFGTFGVFALLGHKIIDRRKQRQMGGAWAALLAQVKHVPFALELRNMGATAIRLGIAVVIYAGLIWLHPWLFGVSPLT